MTREVDPISHEMGRFNQQSDLSTKENFGFIVSLFKFKNLHLRMIGDQFIQHFWQKENPTIICLHLIALYEELSAAQYVIQRLIVCYLLYRSKELWKHETVEKAGMFSHPCLLIFVKIYWNFVSPPGRNVKDRSLLHLLGDFPKITAQEAFFIGRILTSPPHILKNLFELTPAMIAIDFGDADQIINIDPLRLFIEQQLRQFPFFEAVVLSTSTSSPPTQTFSAFANASMFPSLQQIVLSLVSPTAANTTLHNKQLNSRMPTSTQMPSNPVSRRTIINSAYGFFPTSSNTTPFPPGIVNRLTTASPLNPSNVASSVTGSTSTNAGLPPALLKLLGDNTFSSAPTSAQPMAKFSGYFDRRSHSPIRDISKLNDAALGASSELRRPLELPNSVFLPSQQQSSSSAADRPTPSMFPSDFFQDNERFSASAMSAGQSGMVRHKNYSLSYVPDQQRPLPNPIGTPVSDKRNKSTSSSSASLPTEKIDDEVVVNRKFALDMLKKIAEGNGASLSKSQVTKLLGILNFDKEILPMVEISVREFEVIVESQPDLAAEVLVQFHTSNSPELYKSLEALLNVELSVQSMVTVSRFISSCDRNLLYILEAFLNSYITHCIQTCDQFKPNQPSAHRLVRMICVFFSTLVRLSNFNIRPRIAEIQNFATMFSSVKETSQLYQAITQMK